MMKELLVMVSEEFRKEYHDTTGKIYRNLKSGVESFMVEDGCFVRWIEYGREVKTKELKIEAVESILFEKHIDGNVIINYFKTLENREIAHLSIPRRNIIKLDKLANGMKVGTWFE